MPAYFYRSDRGREPVREWLRSLESSDRKAIGEDIRDVEIFWPVGMPLVRLLGNDLWEVRSGISDGRTARIIFCIEKGRMVLLHGFVKKSLRTPKKDIDLATKRKKGAV